MRFISISQTKRLRVREVMGHLVNRSEMWAQVFQNQAYSLSFQHGPS